MNENIKLAALGSIHELCAKSRVLRSCGRADDAKVAMLFALNCFHSTPDLDEINFVKIQDELGNVCFCRAEYAEAEMHYQQAIALIEETMDPEHLCIAVILDHLARLYIFQDRLAEAELVCRRALALKQASMLAQDSDTLESMRMTAIVELYLGDYDEAEKLLRKAIDILEPATIGPFEEFLRLLARVHEGKGNKLEAEKCYKRALEVFRSRKGQQSGLAQCQLDYARLLDELGRNDEAERARRLAAVAEAYRKKADDLPENAVYQPLTYPVTIFH